MDSEGTDTFTFPSISQDANSTPNIIHNNGKENDKLKAQSTTESSLFNQLQQRAYKNRERAVAARKGVEVTTAGSEGSLTSWEASTTHFENRDSLKSSSYTSQDHISTVTARKGVSSIFSFPDGGLSTDNGDSVKTTSAVTVEDILSKTDSSFKNDNTTIKPRKGVDPDGDLGTVKIKPRKGVDVLHPVQDVNGLQVTRSKVKPRKGVVLPPSPTGTPAMNYESFSEISPKPNDFTSVASYVSTNYLNQTSPSNVAQSSDLISVLEQVFRDESDAPEVDLKFSYSTSSAATSTPNIFTVSSTPVSSAKYDHYKTHSGYTAVTESNYFSTLTESTTMPFHTVLPSKTSNHYETLAKSTPPLTTVTERLKLQSVSQSPHGNLQTLSPSTIPLLQTSMSVDHSLSSVENTHHYHTSVLLFTEFSPNKSKKPLAATVDDAESERKYKSSMHLVLSLVFGLLVLFVVLGAVAKRVYDVWMRRHYHRMDFLIDGMYDGFS